MNVMKERLTLKNSLYSPMPCLYEPMPNYDCHMLRGGAVTVDADDMDELEVKMLQSQVSFGTDVAS